MKAKLPLFRCSITYRKKSDKSPWGHRTIWLRAIDHTDAEAKARKTLKRLKIGGIGTAGPYEKKPQTAKAFCLSKGWRLTENKFANKGYYVRPNDQFNWTPPRVHKLAADAWDDGVDMINDGLKFSGDLQNPAGGPKNSAKDLKNSNLKLESWFQRAVDLLAENDQAWDGEEDSVKEEKEELIDSNTKFFKDLEKDNPIAAANVDAHKLIRDLSNALSRLLGNMSPPSDLAPTGPYSFADNYANAKAVIERAASFEA